MDVSAPVAKPFFKNFRRVIPKSAVFTLRLPFPHRSKEVFHTANTSRTNGNIRYAPP
jgi:hypothetical protein